MRAVSSNELSKLSITNIVGRQEISKICVGKKGSCTKEDIVKIHIKIPTYTLKTIMTLFEHTFYINLESRRDRLAHVRTELAKMQIAGERIEAIKMANGAIGCTMSHIHCLETAKSRNLPQVFICEDDITFLNPSLLHENVGKFEKSGIAWDVIIIGGNNAPPYLPISDYCIRVGNNQTTTGYIVKQHYYDTLIQNFRESAAKFMSDPNNKRAYALDIYWKSLQHTGMWFMIIPATVVQYDDYSDIEGRYVRYLGAMLDVDKKKWPRPTMNIRFTK